jgi:hypothetical protein
MWHLERVHAECIGKTPEFFYRKQNEFNKRRQVFAKIKTVTSEPLLTSLKVAYRIIKCKKPLRSTD